MIKKEKDISALIKADPWMLKILEAVKTLNLPDWWICAGFVRSKVWDELHGFTERTAMGDIDVVYFDPLNLEEAAEKMFEEKLNSLMSGLPWSVKNQARMHEVNQLPPYTSSVDAISKFPETATALGVKLDEQNELVLTAPCGIKDLLNLQVKPTEHFKMNKRLAEIYRHRLEKKNWKAKWPEVEIYGMDGRLAAGKEIEG